MLKLIESCRSHLASVDETYAEHLFFAGGTGFTMIVAGSACIIHGLFPFLFDHTGSRTIQALAARIEARKRLAQRDRRERTNAPEHDKFPGSELPYLWG